MTGNVSGALNYAIEEDNAEVVAVLVAAGADVNWTSESHVGWNPLLHAVDAESDSANQTGSPMDLRLVRPIRSSPRNRST